GGDGVELGSGRDVGVWIVPADEVEGVRDVDADRHSSAASQTQLLREGERLRFLNESLHVAERTVRVSERECTGRGECGRVQVSVDRRIEALYRILVDVHFLDTIGVLNPIAERC